MNSLKKYPVMDVKAAVISGLTLCVWGAFIIGMQTYILVCYTQKFHDQLVTNAADKSWGDAYNGLALANAGACLLFGAFAAISIPEKKTSLLILDMVLAVLGACGAAGSTVLAAIETDWLNVNVNTESTHPCTKPDQGDGFPTTLDCTNWIYLQVTVAVLSGLAFCSYTAIAVIVGLGLSSGRGPTGAQMMPSNKSFYDDTASNKTSSFSSPYQAYQPQQPMSQTNGIATNPDPYSDQHPQYSKHLQQLSIQQLAMEQEHKQAMMMNNNNKPAPTPITRQAPPPPPTAPSSISADQVVQRGRLSVMYNQRGPAPPPPVPPKTYNNNNNNYY